MPAAGASPNPSVAVATILKDGIAGENRTPTGPPGDGPFGYCFDSP
jgi:hypothetical protein